MTDENLAKQITENNAPFGKHLGIEITVASKERIEAVLEVTPEKCTMPATLHGGAIMAFADNLGGVGAFLNMPMGWTTSTVESKTNFLRPVPLGQKASAVTRPIKLGRTLQVWETRISRDDGKLAAIVTQTQILIPPSDGKG